MTSSPGPICAAASATCSALVPLFTAMPYLEPQYSAKRFWNSSPRGPVQ